jgi:esterase/lipase
MATPAPFFLAAGEEGVLLIHGFTGSPAEHLLRGRLLVATIITWVFSRSHHRVRERIH